LILTKGRDFYTLPFFFNSLINGLTMFVKNIFIISFLGFLGLNIASSQPWMEKFDENTSPTFFEIQREFEEYWKDKDYTQKGSGWKQFKRWENYWESRVHSDGTFPAISLMMRERMKWNENVSKNPSIQSSNKWNFIGPDDSPGGYAGLGRVNCVYTHPSNNNIVWAGTSSGGLWKSTNGGTSWTTNTDKLDVMQSLGVTDLAIDPNNVNIMYMATGDAMSGVTSSLGVLKSTDGGTTWRTTGLSWTANQTRRISRIIIDHSNSNTLYIGSSQGVWKSTNGGTAWTQQINGNVRDLEQHPTNPNILYLSGATFYRSTDAGANWSQVSSGIPTSGTQRMSIDICPTDSNVVYALAAASNNGLNGVYKSTNAGISFTQVAGATPNMLGYNVDGIDGPNDSKGQGWYDLTIAVNPKNSNEVIIGGINLWRTTNGGTNWVNASMWYGNFQGRSTVHADQHHLRYTPDGNKVYLGNDGGVYSSTNGGAAWNWVGRTLEITQFYKIGVAQTEKDVLIGGTQDNGSKIFDNGTWLDAIGGDGMESLVDYTNSNIMYGSLYYGSVFRSTNKGRNFRRINDANNDGRYDDINETGGWVTPYMLDPNTPTTIFIGMKNVWKSTNSGANFTRISNYGSSANLSILKVAPSSSGVIYTGTSSLLRKTTNGGTSWTSLSFPSGSSITSIEISHTNPDSIWVTAGQYRTGEKVYFSSNGGTSWNNISKNLPNIPVNCIIVDKNSDNNRLYIGTDLGVFYTDDDSNVWYDFNAGLPNVIIRDLHIQYNYGRIVGGSYGRGIWWANLPNELDPPALILPVANAEGVNINNTEFRWQSVVGADQYRIQIYSMSNLGTPIKDSVVTNTSYFLHNSLDYYWNYRWRVLGIQNGTEGSWSDYRDFETTINSPNIIFPKSSDGLTSVSPNFQWSAVEGATRYQIQISTIPTFINVLHEELVSDTSKNDFVFEHNTLYYWRVRAGRNAYFAGWSGVGSFNTILATPYFTNLENNDVNIPLDFDAQWITIPGANSYQLRLSVVGELANELIIDSVVNALNFKFDLENFTTYMAQVSAINTIGQSNWSDPVTFRTQLPIVSLINPLVPTDLLDTVDILEWNMPERVEKVRLQISNDINFGEIDFDKEFSNVSQGEFTGLINNTQYFWRVASVFEEEMGEWSDLGRFTTLLLAPNQVSPENDKQSIKNGQKFTWVNPNETSKTLLEFSASEDFEVQKIVSEEIANNEFTLNQNLGSFTKIYWRLKAETATNYSHWSEIFNFTTALNPPILLYPDNGIYKFDLGNSRLEWQLDKPEFQYEIQIAMDENFSEIIVDETLAGLDSFENFFDKYNTTYFWRVRSIYQSETSDWSEIRSLTTQLEPPTLAKPTEGEEGVFKSAVFEWNQIDGATEYQFEISTSQDMANAVSSVSSTTNINIGLTEELTIHYWRVKAQSNVNESRWSEVASFVSEDFQSVEYFDDINIQVAIFPNPANDLFTVALKGELANKKIKISLIDLLGNVVYNSNQSNINKDAEYFYEINSSEISSGTYLVSIEIDGIVKSMSVKIVR